MVPALQSSKAEIAVAIREGARGSGTSAKTYRLRGLLIASESALAVVLMVGAGLDVPDEALRYASGNLRDVYFYPDQLKGHTERTYRPGE